MLLKPIYGETEADPGQWFTWRQEGDDRIRFRIRSCPPAERKRIVLKHHGKKSTFRLGDKAIESQSDKVAQAEATKEIAAYCLLDSEGFIFPPGPLLAEQLSKHLGTRVEPAPDLICLDGKWHDKVKDEMLRSGFGGELMAFIDECATSIVEQKAAEEEEAGKN